MCWRQPISPCYHFSDQHIPSQWTPALHLLDDIYKFSSYTSLSKGSQPQTGPCAVHDSQSVTGRRIHPKGQQRALSRLWHQMGKFGFQCIARLIGDVTRNPVARRPCRIQPHQRRPHILWCHRDNDLARPFKQNRCRVRSIFTQNHRSVPLSYADQPRYLAFI